ncbi:MAG: hypothetical protein AAGE76_07475 [Pseudomonadota bacterium]
MHILIGLAALAGAAYFWYWRARNAADMAGHLAGAAQDVRLAARRFGFKRKSNIHPVDGIDDSRVAAAGVLAALLAQDGLATEERRARLLVQIQSVFEIDKTQAEELVVLGGWLVGQCGTPGAALQRLARRLYQLAGEAARPDTERMIRAVFEDRDGALPPAVEEGLGDLRARFGVRS